MKELRTSPGGKKHRAAIWIGREPGPERQVSRSRQVANEAAMKPPNEPQSRSLTL